MKKNLLLIVFSILIPFVLSSCSSGKKGEDLAEKFNAKLTGYEKFTNIGEFRALMESAQSAIETEWKEYEGKYKNNAEKWEEFTTAYNNGVKTNMDKYNKSFEKLIRTTLIDQGWYREKDENKYYLYSLSDDSLNVLNCKEKIPYRLHLDTLIFSDTNNTKAIIDFPTDSTMTLTLAGDTLKGIYRKAKVEDLIVGNWRFYRYGESCWINYKENGRYNGQEWQESNYWYGYITKKNVSGTYKIKQVNDTTYKIVQDGGRNGANSTFHMKGVDKFYFYWNNGGGKDMHTRIKKGSPKDLMILFDKAKDKPKDDKKDKDQSLAKKDDMVAKIMRNE